MYLLAKTDIIFIKFFVKYVRRNYSGEKERVKKNNANIR